jgi:hypothetical protein
MSSLTLVSAFFDLASRESSTRPNAEYYLTHGRFLLSLNVNKVIYCDRHMEEPIKKIIDEFGTWDSTILRPTSLEERKYYELLPEASNCSRAQSNNIVKDTVLYSITMWVKFELLEEVAKENPWNNSHIAWFDFGLAHVAETEYAMEAFEELPEQGVRLLMLRPWTKEEVLDPTYYDAHRGINGAGFILGTRNNIIDLCKVFRQEVSIALFKGKAPVDEQILPVIHMKYPTLFKFYYGDYAEILENVKYIRGFGCIGIALSYAEAYGMKHVIIDIIDKVRFSMDNDKLKRISEPEKTWFKEFEKRFN